MAKQNAETGLVSTKSVPDALNVIKKKLEAMKHIQDSVYVTSGKIQMAGGSMDLKSEPNATEVVKAFSSILYRAKAMEEAYEVLGLTGAGKSNPVVKVDGSTVEEWTKDCKLRIDIINQKDELDKLSNLKKKFEELMDKEDRMAILLKEIEGMDA